MTSIAINIDDEEKKILEQRAKKNYLTLKELLEDIIRRSAISYKKNTKVISGETDDKFVNLFSRLNRGRKSKK
jgi:hypothetical protein